MAGMKNYVYLVIAGALAGIIGIFVKLIGGNVHVMTLMFYRMFFAFILVLAVVPFLDKTWYKVTGRDLRHFFIVAIVMTVTFTLFVAANLFVPVQNVVLITNFSPFIVLILAAFFLKEKITKTKIITLIIGIIGVAIINPFRVGENMVGNYLALGQAALYSVLIILMRKENKEHKIGAIIWFFFFATLILLPFPFIFGLGDLSGNVVWYVLALGILSTGVTYLFHNLALEKIGAEISSIIVMIMMPLAGIIGAFFVLNEGFNTRTIIGGVILIIAGIYLQAHEKRLRGAVKKLFT